MKSTINTFGLIKQVNIISMNNLKTILIFVYALLLLFAVLPQKNAYVAARCFKIVASAFSISKMCEALIAYFNRNKNDRL